MDFRIHRQEMGYLDNRLVWYWQKIYISYFYTSKKKIVFFFETWCKDVLLMFI